MPLQNGSPQPEPCLNSAMPNLAVTPDPGQAIRSRIGRALLGMEAAAYAVGLGQQATIFRDANQRTREANRAMLKTAGMEDVAAKDGEDMGDVTVMAGDIIQHPTPIVQPVSTQQPAAPAPTPSLLLSKALPWLLSAGMTAAGFGAAKLLGPEQPPAQPAAAQPASTTTIKGFLVDLIEPKKE